MRKQLQPGLSLFIALFLILSGFFLERFQDDFVNPEKTTRQFQKILYSKEKKIDHILDLIEEELVKQNWEYDFLDSEKITSLLIRNGFILLYYVNDTLKAWSDKSIQISDPLSQSKFSRKIIFLGNAWYKTINRNIGKGYHLVGLILIKYQYGYENQFLHNDFQKKFFLPSCVGLSPNPVEGGEVILDEDEEFLFSLIFPPEPYCFISKYKIPAFLYLFGIVSFLIFLRGFMKLLKRKISPNLLIIIVTVLFAGIEFIMFHYKVPASLFELDLFSPYFFAISNSCSSLGHLLITSLFIFFIAYVFYRDFKLDRLIKVESKSGFFLRSFTGFLFGAIFFALIVFVFKNLLLHSNVSFEPYKILKISYLSLVGYFSIVLLFISLGLYFYKMIDAGKLESFSKLFFLSWLLTIPVILIINILVSSQFGVFSIILYILLGVAIYRLVPGLPYVSLVIFSILFGIYSTYIIVEYSEQKEIKERQVLAVNLSAGIDPIAELLLESTGKDLKKDEGLKNLMKVDGFNDKDVEKIFNYLKSRYFSGYWKKYDLAVTLCGSGSKLIVDETKEEPCFRFFDQMLLEFGTPITSSGFYFLENESSKISYFGSFLFSFDNDSISNGLFITLDSKLFYQQLGYPELLLDNTIFKSSEKNDYSYAKYKHGKLIAQSGDFKYTLRDEDFRDSEEEFSVVHIGDYKHMVYNMGTDMIIVVSQKELKLIDLLISFSYLFVFLFLISNFVYLIASVPFFKYQRLPLLKYKIQLWMISILFLSLVFIGAGTIYFSINQYRVKQYENLSEKIKSVTVELDHKLGYEQELSNNWSTEQYSNLDELLIKFSNVFYSDINLYDSLGNLLATSRPEVFSRGLTGYKMDFKAYRELVVHNQAEFVQEESIGGLQFISAYVPFINRENHLLAYINLPYFTRQSTLTREVTNLVIGIINFSMVLILVFLILAVIISNQITNPLRLIQEKISEIKLGKKNEPIYYDGHDEIGSLIAEYNRMIEELAESAEALAKTERESAWREMARQIAHEIKNPLTPMKLSIQHLQRSWYDKVPNWDNQLKKITRTLIEQIDNLSSIASAFSNFAEMPGTKNVKLDIISVINKTFALFSNNDRVKFQTNMHGNKEAFVYADESQMVRVLNNLVKNSIQSLPNEESVEINIDIKIISNKVIIFISDNGPGIPADLGDKLFEPNFTTKSSGMGLGLAIAKKIIEDANGTINYETRKKEGTTFIIELPEYPQE